MQPIDTVNPTILLAIELSASTWLVAARVPGSEKPHPHASDPWWRHGCLVGSDLVSAGLCYSRARRDDRHCLLL